MNRTTPMKKEDDVRETPPELFAARAALVREGYFTLDACAARTRTRRCRRTTTQRVACGARAVLTASPSAWT
jgi:hypothetical protein